MKLFIEPVDVWLFRDGRPFDRGSDHRARSIFPPLPTVMQGVIRTHHIERNGGIPAYLNHDLPQVEKAIGKPGSPPPDSFRLRGPFVAQLVRTSGRSHDVDLYFSLPADAYRDGDTYRAFELQLPDSGVLTDLEQNLLWPREDREPEKEDEVEGGVWLGLEALREYLLKGELPASCVKHGADLFKQESRFGIGRDDQTRVTKEGLLYEVDFIRTQENVGLYAEVEGIDGWDGEGVLGIGGERGSGYYRFVTTSDIRHPISPDAHRFKVVFLTPTFLKKGWQADDWEVLLGPGVTFKGAAVNRRMTLGGFNQATKEQRPARRYVPTGSVYFFEGRPPLQVEAITQYGAKIGFGQFMIGGW
jgi:CRISPR-associated protein Cmr3